MNGIKCLLDYIKNMCESNLDRLIQFVFGMASVNQELPGKPDCPYCDNSHVIKYGRSIWVDFIQDKLYGETLDGSAESLLFSHQTAFNM